MGTAKVTTVKVDGKVPMAKAKVLVLAGRLTLIGPASFDPQPDVVGVVTVRA